MRTRRLGSRSLTEARVDISPEAKVRGLAHWDMFAGGTGSPDKHSYQWRLDNDLGYYDISPIPSQYGRHLGYRVTYVNTGRGGFYGAAVGLHNPLNSDGTIDNSWNSLVRSPQAGVRVARAHYGRYFWGRLAGS